MPWAFRYFYLYIENWTIVAAHHGKGAEIKTHMVVGYKKILGVFLLKITGVGLKAHTTICFRMTFRYFIDFGHTPNTE